MTPFIRRLFLSCALGVSPVSAWAYAPADQAIDERFVPRNIEPEKAEPDTPSAPELTAEQLQLSERLSNLFLSGGIDATADIPVIIMNANQIGVWMSEGNVEAANQALQDAHPEFYQNILNEFIQQGGNEADFMLVEDMFFGFLERPFGFALVTKNQEYCVVDFESIAPQASLYSKMMSVIVAHDCNPSLPLIGLGNSESAKPGLFANAIDTFRAQGFPEMAIEDFMQNLALNSPEFLPHFFVDYYLDVTGRADQEIDPAHYRFFYSKLSEFLVGFNGLSDDEILNRYINYVEDETGIESMFSALLLRTFNPDLFGTSEYDPSLPLTEYLPAEAHPHPPVRAAPLLP